MPIEKLQPGDPLTQSADVVADNVAKLRELFPQLVTEGPNGTSVNVDVLKQLVGDQTVTDADEKFGLNWHGKRHARQIALTPSTGTLRPAPDESVDWDTTRNLFIEGDNLEVLKLLQKSYAGRVKLIYIDPPYNQDADVIYRDDFSDGVANYKMLTSQVDSEGRTLSSAKSTSGRYHTQWLSMLSPRLRLAWNLLSDDGVILASIDDGEVHHLKSLLSDVFGRENFLSILIWNKQHSQQQGLFKRYHEYVICFAKNSAAIGSIGGGVGEINAGALKKISRGNPASDFSFPAGVRFDARDGDELSGTFGDSEQVTVVEGRFVCEAGLTKFPVTLRAGWTQRNQMESWFAGRDTVDTRGQKVLEFYFNSAGKLKCRKERTKVTPPSLLPEYGMVSAQTSYLAELMGASVFPTPKPVPMLEDFLKWFVADGDIAMDFFAGSGTLGEAAMKRHSSEGGPRFVLVQLPELLDESNPDQRQAATYCRDMGRPQHIAELAKERLRRAGRKIDEGDLDSKADVGFRVFKLDDSALEAWDPQPEDVGKLIAESDTRIKPDRTIDDLLYELLLRLGLDLCTPIDERTIGEATIHAVGGGTLIACLTDKIDRDRGETLTQAIVDWHRELDPIGETTVVFRDDAFADDVVKTNVAAILEQNGLTNVKSL